MWTEQHFLGLIMISVLTLATLFAGLLNANVKEKENTSLYGQPSHDIFPVLKVGSKERSRPCFSNRKS